MKKITFLGVALVCFSMLTACGNNDEALSKVNKKIEDLSKTASSLNKTAESLEVSISELETKIAEEEARPATEAEEKLKEAGFRVSITPSNGILSAKFTLINPDSGTTITVYVDKESSAAAPEIGDIHYANVPKDISETIYRVGKYQGDSKAYESYVETVKQAGFTAGKISDFYYDYMKVNWDSMY